MSNQPNSYHCFVCGVKNDAGLRARFQNEGPGRVRVSAPEYLEELIAYE